MEPKSIEIMLSRPELVYILNALQAQQIVGVELEEFSLPQPQFNELLQQAEQQLIRRSLLRIDENSNARTLAPGLVAMVGALAFRSMAIILVRGIQGKGQQLFVFNLYHDIFVEHTLPQEGVHRLMSIDTADALFMRLEDLVPLHPVTVQGRPRITMEQDEFKRLYDTIQSGTVDLTLAGLLSKKVGDEIAQTLVTTLQKPLVTLSLACFEVHDDIATDASSVAVFADEYSSWGLWQDADDPNPSHLVIFPTGINDIRAAFAQWLGLSPDDIQSS